MVSPVYHIGAPIGAPPLLSDDRQHRFLTWLFKFSVIFFSVFHFNSGLDGRWNLPLG